MDINIEPARLLPGTRLEGDGSLTLTKEGGGLLLPELQDTALRYLVFDLEALHDHSQAFELRLFAGEDKPRFVFRFGVMPCFPARVCVDLQWLDGHILFPGHPPGMLKTVCHGSRIAREEITRAELVNCACHHDVHIRLQGIRMMDSRPAGLPLPARKVIDEMGQYKGREWTGKTGNLDRMRAGLQLSAALPDRWPFADWNKYGGYTSMRLKAGTGFFSRIKQDSRWHLLDPDGCAFFSTGLDCVTVGPDCRVDGMEDLMDWLPSMDEPEYGGMYRIREEPWGEVPRENPRLFSFMQANLYRAFGQDWNTAWQEMIIRQLKNAGINTLGNWSDPALCSLGRLPYVCSLQRFPQTDNNIFRDFPDVYSQQYEQDAEICAQSLVKYAGDPWLIGYFLRNEPAWAFVDGLVIADEVLRGREPSACREEMISWLSARYDSVEALNMAWNTSFEEMASLRMPISGASRLSKAAEEDMRAFSRLMLERYMSVPSQACRRVDPDHMNLGMRWAWISDPDVISGWQHFDVFSINCYAVDPTEMLDQVASLGVDLPVMIGEYHHGALDAGLTATGLKGVTSQAERGIAYRHYCQHAAAHLLNVGCHYFQCYDQFALGRFDGENYNIGLFDVCLKPHKAFLRYVKDCHGTIYQIKADQMQPASGKPKTIPMIAY